MFISAIIFVVDSHNTERMKESHAELVKLMTEKRLSDALLLVYANKQVREELIITSTNLPFYITDP